MKESLIRALACSNNMRNAIQSVLNNQLQEELEDGEVEENLIVALDASIRAYQTLREMLEELPDPSMVISRNVGDGLIPPVQVLFCEDWQCHCRIDAPPILKYRSGKHKAAAAHYIDAVAESVMAEVIKNISLQFKKMRSAYIIYVSHITCGKTARSAYFDNDNLAIKGLLDAIVPLICVDDAAIYCDNIYLAQPDEESYVDLYVVEKPRLREWAQAHRELDFARSILGNTEVTK